MRLCVPIESASTADASPLKVYAAVVDETLDKLWTTAY